MSDYEIESETVETVAGTYTVRWLYDDSPEQPYDNGFGLAMVRRDRWRIDHSVGEHADEVASLVEYHGRGNAYNGNIYDHEIRSSAAIARYLRIKHGIVGVLAVDDDYNGSQPSADRGETFVGLAWAPSDATDPDEYTRIVLSQWKAWANGDVFGWVAEDPSGEQVGSCWGYFDFDAEREYTLSEAKSAIDADVAERIDRANRAGAGVVDLI
jgi:hypothetical protein